MRQHFVQRATNKITRSFLSSAYCPFKQYVVTEYPKSGGSWVAEMLSAYLEVPFPRNRVPRHLNNILHGHYLKTGVASRTLHVVRDGRDVVVSFYYHCFFVNDRYNERLVERMTRQFGFKDRDDIETNLPVFIRGL